MDVHDAAGVSDPAFQREFSGKAQNERTKPDALHSAGHGYSSGLPGVRHAAPYGSEKTSTPLVGARSRIPAVHQMRHAPSSETMQGPTGDLGVQAAP